MIRVILEADLEREEFQKSLGTDKLGGVQAFDLMDAIIWEMDYGESSNYGEPSTHNGISIKYEEVE